MRALCLLSALLLSAPALAETDMRFAYFRDQAQALEDGGLGAFLDGYIGACRGFFDGQRCLDKAAKFRGEHQGKKHWSVILEGDADMLRMTEFNPQTNEYTLLITPVFADGGYFLSHGSPERVDERGNPLFRVVAVRVKAKRGATPMQVAKLFEEKLLRVQFVFTPKEVWSLENERKRLYGVNADVHAILVTVGASGEKIAGWYEDEKAPKKTASQRGR